MKSLFFFLALVTLFASYAVSASPVTAIVVFPTTIKVAGYSVGNNSVAVARCTTFKHATCSPTAPVAVLGRFPSINITTFSLNSTVPVVESVSNFTIGQTWADLFVQKSGWRYLAYPLVFNSTIEYWTGSLITGRSTAVGDNCGGDWESNTTGIAGVTTVKDSRWLVADSAALCMEQKQHLCACESTVVVPRVYLNPGWCSAGINYTDDQCNLIFGLVFGLGLGSIVVGSWAIWQFDMCGRGDWCPT